MRTLPTIVWYLSLKISRFKFFQTQNISNFRVWISFPTNRCPNFQANLRANGRTMCKKDADQNDC